MHIVTNLLFVSLLMGYEIREICDDSLRESMAYRFESQYGRKFWPTVRAQFAANATTSRRRRFIAIADDEHRTAMARHAVTPERAATQSWPERNTKRCQADPAGARSDRARRRQPTLVNRPYRQGRTRTTVRRGPRPVTTDDRPAARLPAREVRWLRFPGAVPGDG
jgi:CHAD domain-containing protein